MYPIAKMYKFLLSLETENEQVKDCMLRWAKIFRYILYFIAHLLVISVWLLFSLLTISFC